MLLTELALDNKDISIYDLSTAINFIDKLYQNPNSNEFKCYMDHLSGEFYIEINEGTPLKTFSRSILLKMIEIAENEKAKKLYACFRKSIPDIEKFMKIFLFIGFKIMTAEEMKEFSMTETHLVLKYDDFNNDDI